MKVLILLMAGLTALPALAITRRQMQQMQSGQPLNQPRPRQTDNVDEGTTCADSAGCTLNEVCVIDRKTGEGHCEEAQN